MRLCLNSEPQLQLERTDFFRPDSASAITCFRGSAFNLPPAYSGFRWSSAVQALCVLFLRHAAQRSQQSNESIEIVSRESEFLLRGEAGSLAASLDYAISKQPGWIQDMFGISREGQLILKSFIVRTNPERKRPGPVAISIDNRKLAPEQIEVSLDGLVLEQPEQLTAMAERIAQSARLNSPSTRRVRKQSRPSIATWQLGQGSNRRLTRLMLEPVANSDQQKSTETDSPLRDNLRQAYIDEISLALRSSVVFDQKSYRARLRTLQRQPELLKRNSSKMPFEQMVDGKLFGSQGIGVSDSSLDLISEKDSLLRIVVPKAEASVSAICAYLKLVKGYNIELTSCFPHALQISNEMRHPSFAEQFDLALLSLASAATYCSSVKTPSYQPFMVMPTISYSLLRPVNADRSVPAVSASRLFYIDGAASYTACLKEEIERGLRRKTSSSRAFESQQQIAAAFAAVNENDRALLWFPFDRLLEFSGQAIRDNGDQGSFGKINAGVRSELMLFCNSSLARQPKRLQSLAVAIRGAWVHLMQDSQLLEILVDYLLNSNDHSLLEKSKVATSAIV